MMERSLGGQNGDDARDVASAQEARQPQSCRTGVNVFCDNPPDYDHWLQMDYWTWAEAFALSVGFDPDHPDGQQLVSDLPAIRSAPTGSKYEFIKNRLEVLCRAKETGRLSERFSPEKFLRWADDRGMKLPAGMTFVGSCASAAQSRAGEKAYTEGASSNKALEAPPKDRSSSAQTLRIRTLQKVLLGIAKTKYKYDPAQRGSAAGRIASDVANAGLSVCPDTVLALLREAAAEGD